MNKGKSVFFRSSFFRFVLVGGIGFIIEAITLTLIAQYSSLGPIWGRAVSFPLAVLSTWWLNRKLTFRSQNPPGAEGVRYFAVQILGALTNTGIFIVTVKAIPSLWNIPVVPLAFGSLGGLVVNFILSAKVVFVPLRPKE